MHQGPVLQARAHAMGPEPFPLVYGDNVNETKAWVHGVASRLRVMLSLAWPTMARLGSFVARVNLRVVF